MKILILGDLHFGVSRTSTTHSNQVRQANTQAKSTLEALLPTFKEAAFDLIVHMGDCLRDTYIEEEDATHISEALSLIAKIEAPTIHLLGNHELRAFSREKIEEIYKKNGIVPQFGGQVASHDLTIQWLDLELDENDRALLPQVQKDRIAQQKTKPDLVFSHFPLVSPDESGTFYFENDPGGMCYKDGEEILSAFGEKRAPLYVSAHVHFVSHLTKDGSHYITNPAFSENIAAQDYPENNPGIYSVLEVDKKHFIFTSYSGPYCFSKIQGTF